MPAILPRPDQPTFYPDTSTLSYAFDGLTLGASPGMSEVSSLIQDVAQRANLCLSFAHLLEFVIKGDWRDVRIARAQWLDTLDVVWLRDQDEVLNSELEQFLRRAAGLHAEPLRLPTAASFLATFRGWTPELIAELLSDSSVTRLVKTVGDDQSTREGLARLGDVGPAYNQRLFLDRKAALNEASEDEIRLALKKQVDQKLLATALEVNRQLPERDFNYRIEQNGLWVAPGDDFVRSAIRPLDEVPNDFPLVFVLQEVFRNVGSVVARKQHLNSKFLRSPNRRGDFFDWYHLIGAAYCDVFVCDADTSDRLANARERLGRSKEFTYRGDYSRLAQELRAALHL